MKGSLDLASVGGFAAEGIGIVGAVHADYIACLVPFHAGIAYQIGPFEPHLPVGGKTEIPLGRILAVVVLLNVNLAGEGHGLFAQLRLVGIDVDEDFLGLSLGIVINYDLEGTQHRHGARGVLIEIVAHAGFEQGVINHRIGFGYADFVHKIPDGRRRISPAAQPADGGHARDRPSR